MNMVGPRPGLAAAGPTVTEDPVPGATGMRWSRIGRVATMAPNSNEYRSTRPAPSSFSGSTTAR